MPPDLAPSPYPDRVRRPAILAILAIIVLGCWPLTVGSSANAVAPATTAAAASLDAPEQHPLLLGTVPVEEVPSEDSTAGTAHAALVRPAAAPGAPKRTLGGSILGYVIAGALLLAAAVVTLRRFWRR